MIHGVEIKELVTHTDERGLFREIIRKSDDIFPEGFGQWSHTMSYTGVAKAWHVHQKQTDWWYVAVGTSRPRSMTPALIRPHTMNCRSCSWERGTRLSR